MNYFPFHVGDYVAATAHLSWDEDMAYTRLIRVYYQTEKPIPKDKAYRLARATTTAQKAAVDSVLEEFFVLDAGAYQQSRCEEEIANHQKAMARLIAWRDGDSYRRFRSAVIERDGEKCAYCGAAGVPLHLDHIHPKSKGGKDVPENLTPACKPCNSSKGSKTLTDWMVSRGW